MTKGFFDDLARALATPMPRRGALRTIGAALAMGAFDALRPRRADAHVGTAAPSQDCGGGCGPVNKACCVKIKYGLHNGGCCTPLQECCVGSNNSTGTLANLMSWCCAKGMCGPSGGICRKACEPGRTVCGNTCCPPGWFCGSAPLSTCCKNGQQVCGGVCCSAEQECRDGKCCEKCGNGTCCDPSTEFCCPDMNDRMSGGTCCNKAKDSCCVVGPPSALTRVCCSEPNKCTKQLPRGIGGLMPGALRVCCPPARQVRDEGGSQGRVIACCDPSQVSLGARFMVGRGIQGMCCDAGKICGSGANLTCCQTGESCIGGTRCR